MLQNSSLADEIAAEIELGLPSAAQRAAGRLKLLNETARHLKTLGLNRSLDIDLTDSPLLLMAGISSANVTVPAFGGLLFGATSLAQGMRISGSNILESWEQARVKMGDMDLYGKDERLRWQQIQLAFDVLEALIEERKAQIILLDLPLFVSRREEAVISDDGAIAEEWEHLSEKVNSFWEQYLSYVYPFNSEGVIICSLRTHSATSLFSALKENPTSSSDPEGVKLARYFDEKWNLLQQLGQSRLLDHVLSSSARSIAYSYEDLNLDPRWQPSALHQVGILGFFMRARQQTEIWHIQIPGHKTQWSPEKLNLLASNLIRATLYNDRSSLPLPLWFAKSNVKFPRQLLLAYREGIEKELTQHEY